MRAQIFDPGPSIPGLGREPGPRQMGFGRGPGPSHQAKSVWMEKEVVVDDLGERSQDVLPSEREKPGQSRRDFLKKAAGIAVSLPAAGAIVGQAAAQQRMTVTDRIML